jgi:hypothetical protein
MLKKSIFKRLFKKDKKNLVKSANLYLNNPNNNLNNPLFNIL